MSKYHVPPVVKPVQPTTVIGNLPPATWAQDYLTQSFLDTFKIEMVEVRLARDQWEDMNKFWERHHQAMMDPDYRLAWDRAQMMYALRK